MKGRTQKKRYPEEVISKLRPESRILLATCKKSRHDRKPDM